MTCPCSSTARYKFLRAAGAEDLTPDEQVGLVVVSDKEYPSGHMACISYDEPAAHGSRRGLVVVEMPTRSMPRLLGPMLAALLTLTCCRHAAACARPVPIRTSEYLAVEGAELFLLTRGA